MTPRRRGELLDDVDPDRLHVFVPAIMSVGVLFSLFSLLHDLVRWGGEQALRRHSRAAGAQVAALVTGHPVVAPRPTSELRRRLLAGAAVAIAVAAYVSIRSVDGYRRDGGDVEHLGWLLALALVASTAVAAVGAAFAAWAWRLDHPPAWAVELLRHTGLAPSAEAHDRPPVSPVRLRLAAASGALAAALTVVIAAADGVTAVDRWIADRIHELGWYGWAAALDPLGRTEVAVALAGLIGLAALRCVVVGATYPAAVALSLVVSSGLHGLIDQDRPDAGPFAGRSESFPSGHLVQATIIAGLFPLALGVVTGRRRVVLPLRVLLGLGVAASSLGRVDDHLHWPSDVVGGVLVGLAVVLLAEWALEHESWHQRCRDCLWHPAPARPARRGALPIGTDVARAARSTARAWSLVAVLVLAALTLTVGVPQTPGEGGFGVDVQVPVQLASASLLIVGVLVAWRWEAVGALVIAASATAMGIFTAVEYRPVVATALVGLFVVPAVLFWLSWQHVRRWSEIALLGVGTAGLLGAGWAGASAVYDSYFGPTHAESDTAALPVERVAWVWSGALQPRSATIVVRIEEPAAVVAVRAHPDDGGPAVRSAAVPTGDDHLARLELADLQPGTRYDYTVVVDGAPDGSRGAGTFRTPSEGPMSFEVAIGSCARTGTNGAVFDTIRRREPLLFLHLGDLHYRNIRANSTDAFLAAYHELLTAPAPGALWRSVPVSYVWDDHDYGPDDADANSPSREAARAAYRRAVAHHPLPAGEEGAIYHAFTIGRVRFVLTDGRSERTDGTLLGQVQLRWLIDELTTAARSHALVVWANEVPWIQAPGRGADGWGAHPAERQQVADAIARAGISNLVMVSGDAHMVALDDGTNSGYASDGSAGFPVLHAAALDRPGRVKGGPYSHGTFPGGGRFGTLAVTDDGGDEVTVELTGRTWDDETLVSWTGRFEVPADARTPAGIGA